MENLRAIKVFYYDELEEDIREEIKMEIENQNDGPEQFEFDDIREEIYEFFENEGFEIRKLYYDFSYSQSDHLDIDGKIKQQKIFEILKENLTEKERKRFNFLVEKNSIIEIENDIEYLRNRKQNVKMFVDFPEGYDLIGEFANRILLIEDEINSFFERKIREIKRQVYERIDYLHSSRYIEDNLKNSDNLYNENGKQIFFLGGF